VRLRETPKDYPKHFLKLRGFGLHLLKGFHFLRQKKMHFLRQKNSEISSLKGIDF